MTPVRLAALCLAWSVAGWASAGQVYVAPLDGSQPPRRVSPEVGRDCGSPYWSPDGERLAYDSWPVERDFGSAELRVVNADGTGLVRLCEGSVPSWSADGTLIAFHAYRPRQRIGVVNADGTGEETLFYDAWSPRWVDGRSKIAAGHRGLSVFDVAARTTVRVSGVNIIRPGFSYSPVTERFAVVEMGYDPGTRGQTYRLVIAPLKPNPTGPRTRTLVSTQARIGQVSWAPDGRRLVAAIGSIDLNCRLYEFDVDGGGTRSPIDAAPNDWIACNPNWSPDGEWIAFVRMGDEQDPPPVAIESER